MKNYYRKKQELPVHKTAQEMKKMQINKNKKTMKKGNRRNKDSERVADIKTVIYYIN